MLANRTPNCVTKPETRQRPYPTTTSPPVCSVRVAG
jgi:hypothetical protein